MPAEKLQLYDEVELSDGTHALIENLWHEKTGEEIPVYNMEVEEFHTYYIAKTGVLVHNDGGCGHSGGKVRISSKSGKTTNKTTRRQAFRQAKEAAGIPKSAQYKTHKFIYDGSSENRIVYEFNVNGDKKYIIEHLFDKLGRGNHFHGADATKGSPFDKGRYNQYDGHFPEDFDGVD